MTDDRLKLLKRLVFGFHGAFQTTTSVTDTVLHELLPLVPHIDVYRFPPNGKRDFFIFVTGGMSDLPMNSPSELGADYRRAELVFYSTEDRDHTPSCFAG